MTFHKLFNYGLSAFLIVYMIGTLVLIKQQQWAIEDLRMQIAYTQQIQTKVTNNLGRDDHALSRELGEFQRWRKHVTVASRLGWQSAARYIREFPLQYRYVDDGSDSLF